MFGDEYFQKFGFREQGFRAMFAELDTFHNPTIVETGTVRSDDSFSTDGSSTRFFYDYIKTFGGMLITIDIDPKAAEIASRLCPEAVIITGDSVNSLWQAAKRIDFLYLDDWDVVWEDHHLSALHHLSGLAAATRLLSSGSVVAVDDNRGPIGKGAYIRHFMEKVGATQILEDYQLIYRMP